MSNSDPWYFNKGAKRFIYYLGWLGVLNVLYWIIQIVSYLTYDSSKRKVPFFGVGFHRRTYKWGIFYLCILAVALVFAVFIILSRH
jgi:hypothetical protein